LYKHFPRKDDLVLAYLDKVDQAWFRASSRAAARAAGDDPANNWSSMFDALGTAARRRTATTAARSSTPPPSPDSGSDEHARTVEHKHAGARLGARPYPACRRRRPRPARRQLTLLIDGGLAAGVLDAHPATPAAAKAAARVLIDAACGHALSAEKLSPTDRIQDRLDRERIRSRSWHVR
jgi:AcrR family transcriptional regulator